MIPSHSSGFREFKVYDKARASPDWTSIVSPTQCAVFFKDFETAAPLSPDGVHPSMAEKDELSLTWLRRRRVMAILCFLAAVPLFVWDSRAEWALILPSVIAFNLIFFGLRLLYWNTARGSRDWEHARHLEDHLRREKDSLSNAEDPR